MIPNCHNCRYRYKLHYQYGAYGVSKVCEKNEIPNTVTDSSCDCWRPAPLYFGELVIGLIAIGVLAVIIWLLLIPFGK